jgi:UDP-3-O-[3-hydroxymyristoyl] N-acetylglucosamine deacetylase / 3-hydroxyacyl-[acyl-carrier-protein] dehydratase
MAPIVENASILISGEFLKPLRMNQRTLGKTVYDSGVTLHSGESVAIALKPAQPGTGIQFQRKDIAESAPIPAHCEAVTDLLRNTTLGAGPIAIATVEHVLSALRGMEIDNALIEIDGGEIPIFDGSAKRFVELITEAGAVNQDLPRQYRIIHQPIALCMGDRMMVACPYDGFRVSCTFADTRGRLTQYQDLILSETTYAEAIAGARTFAFYEDIEGLLAQGKIKGGSLDSAIVIKDDKFLSKEALRFDDELVRHKILDIVGDLSLLGPFLKAHIIAIKPGHAINTQFAKLLGQHGNQ